MSNSVLVNRLRLMVFAIGMLMLLFLANKIVFSQSPSPSETPAATAEFNFPVEELGSCADLESCTNYCEDPVNYNSCSDFAKKNGFYKDDETQYGNEEFWQETQSELGCNSTESCATYCSSPENHEKCDAFAKRSEIPGGYTDQPDKPEYLQIAQTVLGCDSLESCSTFCDSTANAQKCDEFADQVGLLGGNTTGGPDGCQTPESCNAYCSDPANFEECSAFKVGTGNFSGPGNCNSEESCRSYCDQNPADCRSYAPGSSGVYGTFNCEQGQTHGPGGLCTNVNLMALAAACVGDAKFWNGTSCQDTVPVGISPELPSAHFEQRPEMDNCSTPGGCYDYCKDNLVNGASVCPGFDTTASRPTDGYTPYLYYTPGTDVKFEPKADMGNCDSPGACYEYCKENPDKCQGFDPKAPQPVDIWIPNTYYTPPTDSIYSTPPTTNFYTTPMYYTPPQGSNYTTPQYYTPGMYSTPNYYTPPTGSNYTTPNYYTPWGNYTTPTGEYPTPTYSTPTYYTPPGGTGYTTPYYYTPPTYTTPFYYTPPQGSNYTTPSYSTPPTYTTPQYYTPYTGGGYTTPVYFTPPTYSTPTYYTPPPGSNYTTPSYYTPPPPYSTPNSYTPGTYPTHPTYTSPAAYTTPTYSTPPPGSTYTSPSYYSPASYSTPSYYTPGFYPTPNYYTPYASPSYYTPPPGSTYTSPSYFTPYVTPNYPTPSYYSPSYYTPGGTYTSPYYSPGSGYTSPTTNYSTPSTTYLSPYYYPTPGGTYTYPTPGTTVYT